MFGDARPREEILQRRGLDPTTVDQQYERKAAPIRYTVEQEERLEAARAALEDAALALREANENEMPEEEFRAAEQVKRQELNALMEEFAKVNVKDETSNNNKTYPSSRRGAGTRDGTSHRGGRFDHEGGGGDKHDPPSSSGRHFREEKKEGDQAFASFGTRRRQSSTSEGQHA